MMGSVVPGVGTVAGAAVGAGAALLTSSVNAWMSVRAQRRRRRELEALKKELRERETAEKMERDSANAYSARLNSLNGAALAYDKNAGALQRMMTSNKNLLRLYVKEGV
jgi:NADP-dependent 3-hydroxy acid dehydrogenase YdfG